MNMNWVAKMWKKLGKDLKDGCEVGREGWIQLPQRTFNCEYAVAFNSICQPGK